MGSTPLLGVTDEGGTGSDVAVAFRMGEPVGLVAADSVSLIAVGAGDALGVRFGFDEVAALPQASTNARQLRGTNRDHWIILAFKVTPRYVRQRTCGTVYFLYGNCIFLDALNTNFGVAGKTLTGSGKDKATSWRVALGSPVSFIVIGLGGAGVWALGRPAIHIGASGLVFGYFGYLVARGWYERKLGSILIAIAVIILYGGLIAGVIPARSLVSWEAHLFGLIAGVLAARNRRR